MFHVCIYMILENTTAASLPLLFIDGAKLHKLNFWYALFPGAAACILLCFLVSYLTLSKYVLTFFCFQTICLEVFVIFWQQAIVGYLKENLKF